MKVPLYQPDQQERGKCQEKPSSGTVKKKHTRLVHQLLQILAVNFVDNINGNLYHLFNFLSSRNLPLMPAAHGELIHLC